jgi:hypothetical protein
MEYASTSHNNPVCALPSVDSLGYGFARSFTTLIPTQNLRHSLSAPEMLRISLFGPSNCRKQPERYTKFFCPNLPSQATFLGSEFYLLTFIKYVYTIVLLWIHTV